MNIEKILRIAWVCLLVVACGADAANITSVERSDAVDARVASPPVWWIIGESHAAAARPAFKTELKALLAAAPSGAGSTVGGSALWSTDPTETWSKNSAHAGQTTAHQHLLVDGKAVDGTVAGESPVTSIDHGVTGIVLFSGTNDAAAGLDLVRLEADWRSALADYEAKAPLSVGNRYCVSPVLSTSGTVEPRLIALRPVARRVCESRGWVYCVAQAGPWALTAGDVLSDTFHLTDFGYQQVARTVFHAMQVRIIERSR